MRLLRSALLVLLAAGCESGLTRSAEVTLPLEVAKAFSPKFPGLLVSDLGGEARAYLGLCGQIPKNPLLLSSDLGFGCLEERAGTTERARAWVQSLPDGVDAAALCAQASTERSFYRAFVLPPADGGVDAGTLPTDPEPTWAQAADEGTWRRDASPCGGVVSFELVLSDATWTAWPTNPSGCPSAETSCIGDRSGDCPMGLSCRYEHPYGSYAVQNCGLLCTEVDRR